MSFVRPIQAEQRALSRESDPELRAEGLLALAGRYERKGQSGAAREIYVALLQDSTLPSPLRERTRSRAAALEGEGSIGNRAELLLSRFIQDATDPSALLAMGAGGLAFRLARLTTLGRLAGSANSFLTRGWGARALSGLAGFGAEATVFPIAARLGNLALGRDQAWTAAALGRDLGSSFLMLGALRAGGWIPRLLAERSTALRPLLIQSGMFGGILLGREMEIRAGLREPSSGSIALVDSLATLLQFNVAGRLNRGLMGEGFGRWEQSVELLSARLGNGPRDFPPPAWPVLEAEMAAASDRAPSQRNDVPRAQQAYSFGSGEGGRTLDALAQARSLRNEIAPFEAWNRRDSLTQEYLQLLGKLPSGRGESLNEIILGVEMLGIWANSDQPFLKAIGHRYYSDAWQIFGIKFSHLDSGSELEQKMVESAYRHYELISQGNNSRFMHQAVRASAVIAGTLHHHRIGLQEGSARDLAVREPLLRILGSLRLGSEVLSEPALRRAYMESWLDSLQALHAGGEFVAREVVGALKQSRLNLLDRDPVRQKQAAEFYPQFWSLLRTVVMTNAFSGFDFGIGEEIVFLQSHQDLKSTPPALLEPVLEAYPFYAEIAIARNLHRPAHMGETLRGLFDNARGFRSSIAATRAAPMRELYVKAYLETILACYRTSVDLLLWPGSSAAEREGVAKVLQEMNEGLQTLRRRWSSESGSHQLRAFDQYWHLAREYPVPAGLADQINGAYNLKPLSFLASHNADFQVRQAAQTLLQNLLNRFRDSARR